MRCLYAAGSRGEVSEELNGFLKLVKGSTNCVTGSFAYRVQNQVIMARQNAEWRREYMEWKMTLLNERIKGREEGLAEGHEKGLAEGREKGLTEGLARGSLMLQIKMITTKVKKGIDLPQIAEAMEIGADLIRPIWEAVKAAAPDYDQEKILLALTGNQKDG